MGHNFDVLLQSIYMYIVYIKFENCSTWNLGAVGYYAIAYAMKHAGYHPYIANGLSNNNVFVYKLQRIKRTSERTQFSWCV